MGRRQYCYLARDPICYYINKRLTLSQIFGSANHFVPNKLEGGYESTKYTDIQYEYVGNLAKMKFLENRIMAYDMRDPFIILTLVDEYAFSVEYHWGNCASSGVYLFPPWSKVPLCVVAQFQRDCYDNFSDDEDIISCEWTKDIFIKSPDTALIKRLYDKYEALNGLDQEGITHLNISLDDIFNISDVVINSLKNYSRTSIGMA